MFNQVVRVPLPGLQVFAAVLIVPLNLLDWCRRCAPARPSNLLRAKCQKWNCLDYCSGIDEQS